jgi:hypothetical protein
VRRVLDRAWLLAASVFTGFFAVDDGVVASGVAEPA